MTFEFPNDLLYKNAHFQSFCQQKKERDFLWLLFCLSSKLSRERVIFMQPSWHTTLFQRPSNWECYSKMLKTFYKNILNPSLWKNQNVFVHGKWFFKKGFCISERLDKKPRKKQSLVKIFQRNRNASNKKKIQTIKIFITILRSKRCMQKIRTFIIKLSEK